MSDPFHLIGIATVSIGTVGFLCLLALWSLDKAIRLFGFEKALYQAYKQHLISRRSPRCRKGYAMTKIMELDSEALDAAIDMANASYLNNPDEDVSFNKAIEAAIRAYLTHAKPSGSAVESIEVRRVNFETEAPWWISHPDGFAIQMATGNRASQVAREIAYGRAALHLASEAQGGYIGDIETAILQCHSLADFLAVKKTVEAIAATPSQTDESPNDLVKLPNGEVLSRKFAEELYPECRPAAPSQKGPVT